MIEEPVEIERIEEMRENLIEEEFRPNEQNNAGRNKIILIALTGIIAASALLCYLIIKWYFYLIINDYQIKIL